MTQSVNNNENNALEDDAISIADVVQFVRDGWKTIVAFSLIGLLGGAGYVFLSAPKYQATANIQTGKVAGADIEAPATLVEKLKLPSYYGKDAFDACGLNDFAEPGVALATALKPTLMKTAPIISMSYKAKSVEVVTGCLNAVMNEIRVNQAMLAKPIFEQKKIALDTMKQKLDTAEKVVEKLQPNKQNLRFSDPQYSAASLMLATGLSKENEVKDLRAQIADAEIQLQEPQTKEAFFTTPVYTPSKPVEPKKLIGLIGGLFGGGVFSIVFLFGRSQYRKFVTKS